jgi:PAS domain S-box-containing protein
MVGYLVEINTYKNLMQSPSQQNIKKKAVHQLEFLPEYAGYLLRERLDDYAVALIRVYHELEPPLLRFYKSITDDERSLLSKNHATQFLRSLTENKIEAIIQSALKIWRQNNIPILPKEYIQVDDIKISGYATKKVLLNFINDFTNDASTTTAIISEIDFLIQEQETCLLKEFITTLHDRFERIQKDAITSEERYHHMIEEVEDYAILLLDTDGNIKNWNRGAEKIKGYSSEEIIGKNFRIFYAPSDQKNRLPEQLITQAIQTGKANHEGWRIRKDGTRFWGNIVITALHDTENKVIGFSKVTRDLTQKKIAEDQLRDYMRDIERKNAELQKTNKELESFSYVASHDLQEPLRKIQAFSNRIMEREKAGLSDSAKDMFERIQSAASRMQALIDALLNFSRASTAPRIFETIDINMMMEDVLSSYKDMLEDQKIHVNIYPLPSVTGVYFQLYQLFTNLINNSIKYRHPERALVIDISSDIFQMENKAYYKFNVKDNGIGFESQYAEKIFELFQRLHGRNEYTGTGIGLSICKKIAENHSGFMRAEGILGKEATFSVYIPLSSSREQQFIVH